MEDVLRVNERVSIPLGEIELRASRSSGPGGQHANVTASRIEAVFDVEASATLNDGRGLVAVLGGVWLQARLLDTPPDIAAHGTTPLGTVPLQLNADLDYAPPGLKPWALACGWQFTSSRPATTNGSQQLPSYSVLSFAVRYEFPLFGHAALVRLDADDVGDSGAMLVDDSGTVMSEHGRSFMLTLTADF